MRGVGFFIPWERNSDSHVSRGTVSIRTWRPSRSPMISAACWGLTRVGPSISTTRGPTHESSMSSAAVLPTSSVATIGNSLSRGWRKLGTTPVLRVGGMSHEKFSIYHFPSSPRRFLFEPIRKKLFGLLRSGDKWSQQRNKTKCETSDHRHKEEAIGVAQSCNLLLPGSCK